MTGTKQEELEKILSEAKRAPKKSYAVYSQFANRIWGLGLGYLDGENALQKLAKILKV